MEELHDESVPVDDHLERDEEIQCGYCGRPFSSHEMRIEKTMYGRKWVFCSEECLHDFRDASNFSDKEHKLDDNLDVTINMTQE